MKKLLYSAATLIPILYTGCEQESLSPTEKRVPILEEMIENGEVTIDTKTLEDDDQILIGLRGDKIENGDKKIQEQVGPSYIMKEVNKGLYRPKKFAEGVVNGYLDVPDDIKEYKPKTLSEDDVPSGQAPEIPPAADPQPPNAPSARAPLTPEVPKHLIPDSSLPAPSAPRTPSTCRHSPTDTSTIAQNYNLSPKPRQDYQNPVTNLDNLKNNGWQIYRNNEKQGWQRVD